jgi:hypothetical protein
MGTGLSRSFAEARGSHALAAYYFHAKRASAETGEEMTDPPRLE